MLIPTQKAPNLLLPTLFHGEFNLISEKPKNFTMLIFFRGLHCPICATYLQSFTDLLPDFVELGITSIAISSDGKRRALEMAKKVGSKSLRYGYNLKLKQAREWGLYISEGRGKTSAGVSELDFFPEPGFFLVKPDNSIFYIATQSMPFARPQFKDLLGSLRFILDKSYPARGNIE